MTTMPLTMKPSGWFQIGWSFDIPVGKVVPMRYFGEELVAARTEDGVLHVMDAHCLHLGAHLGYGGRIEGDCVVCPFHGWVWGTDGVNRAIPGEARPNLARRLRTWNVHEAHGCVFLWHHPDGLGPQWEVPDLFTSVAPERHGDAAQYYPLQPECTGRFDDLTLHPQFVTENSVDARHFLTVHENNEIPTVLGYAPEGAWFRSRMAFYPRNRQQLLARGVAAEDIHFVAELEIVQGGIGLSFTALESRQGNRLMLGTTPVDEHTCAMFQTLYLERIPGDEGDQLPEQLVALRDRSMRQLPFDIEIWQHQRYTDPPALCADEVRPFNSLRRWAQQFYETSAAPA